MCLYLYEYIYFIPFYPGVVIRVSNIFGYQMIPGAGSSSHHDACLQQVGYEDQKLKTRVEVCFLIVLSSNSF